MNIILRITVLTGMFLVFHFNTSAQCHSADGGGKKDSHSGHTSNSGKQSNDAKKSYSCPMHPEVVSPIPGKCPKCGMALELQKISAVEKHETKVYYSCSAHPSVISDKKGKCTVCNKKLKKVKIFSYE